MIFLLNFSKEPTIAFSEKKKTKKTKKKKQKKKKTNKQKKKKTVCDGTLYIFHLETIW